MKNEHTKVTELSKKQQSAIVEAKEVLASKQDVLMAIGQVQAFNNIKKYTTVGELLVFKKIKESKQYRGLVHTDENGKSTTVGDIKEVCQLFFNRSYSSMQEDLQNLEVFGQEFLESSQNMGLGNRELRKLRQLPSEEQALIINSEEVDLSDKEAVKELIEDLTFKQVTEKAELQKQLEGAEATVEAVRLNSDAKQQELDQIKEVEVKRRFTQNPWQHETRDLATGMLEARVLIEQGVNQLTDIFQKITADDSGLDEKALNYCARSILSETTNVNDLILNLVNEVSGLFGDTFKADLDAVEVLHELDSNKE